MENLHRLLKRQVSKYLGEDFNDSPEMISFLTSISEAYKGFNSDFEQLERTLEISSNELYKTNESLNHLNSDLEQKVQSRTTELEKANQVLLAATAAKEEQSTQQAKTEELLKASNDSINQLILCEDIFKSFSDVFQNVASAGQLDDIILINNIGFKSSTGNFKIIGQISNNEKVNTELYARLDKTLNEFFKKTFKILIKNEPVFLRQLEEAAGIDASISNKRMFRNLLCPVIIQGKIHSILVFNSNEARSWTTLEKSILSRLADSAGNLIHRKELERSIQKQQEAILEAQQFSNIGTFEIDFIEQESHFTKQASQLLNLSAEELVYDEELIKRIRKNVVKGDLSMIDSAWDNAIKTKSDVRLDFRLYNQEKEIIYVNWNLKPEFSKSGKVLRVRGTLQDITERVLIEQKAKTAQLIIENSPSILFRWKVEENWPVEYVSSNVLQFGYNQEDFLNGVVKYADLIHPEDYPFILKEIKENKESGNRTYQQVYRIYNKKGEIRWVEDQTLTELDFKGNDIYHQGIITDVTDKVNARIALEESETRFRNLVQNSSDIITILNPTAEVLYESPAFYRAFGFKENEIVGKSAFDFIHAEDIESVKNAFTKLILDASSSISVTFRFRKKDGNYIYLEAIGNNLLDAPGINGIVINSRDVSERFESETQLKAYASSLEKINKELDQFAYIVSHDLKAPLRAINNLAEWIAEDLETMMDDGTKKNISLLKGRIGRMEALINGILQYSRAGRLKAEIIPIPMNDFVSDIISNLSPPENFVVQIQENMPTVEAEKVALDQVFSNFISNAIKYNSNENPIINIGYEDKGLLHCFFVEDNGPGISSDFHEKVFAIFQTLQARDSIESTGVGLAIVKKIVEEKGGNVWLESEEGHGAKFIFTFPKLTSYCEKTLEN
ncbi:MAG: PAS domain-containing protein [Bacteroidia bacterium]